MLVQLFIKLKKVHGNNILTLKRIVLSHEEIRNGNKKIFLNIDMHLLSSSGHFGQEVSRVLGGGIVPGM